MQNSKMRLGTHVLKKCPICGHPADSKHHIKAQADGGKTTSRNIVILCKDCHDAVEGLDYTPALVSKMRLEYKEKSDDGGTEHWVLHKPEGTKMYGIKEGANPVAWSEKPW